jgi:predicted permease
MDTLRRDLRFALRSFGRSPAITALILVTLSLGIGANTAIFSFLNEILLKPLPFRAPNELVTIGPAWDGVPGAVTPEQFVYLRQNGRSFAQLGILFLPRGENVETSGDARHVLSQQVSEGYFLVLDMAPLLGRTFLPEEDVPNGPHLVVLSESLWTSGFQRDPEIVGRVIRISGVPHTVVGVMPAAFSGHSHALIWRPLQLSGRGNDNNYGAIGRLGAGVTLAQASSEVSGLLAAFNRAHGSTDTSRHPGIAISMAEANASDFRQPVLLLYAGVCIVLFVACLNVANLLLARSAVRGHEVAVRAALGASRGRIARQMFTESIVLAGFGCAAGIAIAFFLTTALSRLAPYEALQNVRLDTATLLFTVGISMAAGVASGLAPALHAARAGVNETFQRYSSKTSGGKGVLRGRQILVASQVALCVVLLAGATLLVRTVMNLRSVDPGFDPGNVLTAPMTLNADKLASREVLLTYYNGAIARLHAVPGVAGVAVTTQLPVEGQFNMAVRLPDSPGAATARSMQFRVQSREAFEVLRMRIVHGRDFNGSDSTGAPPAIVNQAFVREYTAGGEPLGQRIAMQARGQMLVWNIVGVVNDVRETGVRKATPPVVYTLVDQVPVAVLRVIHTFGPAKWIIRVRPGSRDPSDQIRRAAGTLDPSQPFDSFQPMEQMIAGTMRMERFLAALLTIFALLTLVMVASGLYGTLAWTVFQRRREIGIRMALGAQAASVAGMVVRSASAQVGAGLAVGLIASYWLTRLTAGLLFRVKPEDPISLGFAAVLLLMIGVVASLAPGVSAIRTDPARTLRAD